MGAAEEKLYPPCSPPTATSTHGSADVRKEESLFVCVSPWSLQTCKQPRLSPTSLSLISHILTKTAIKEATCSLEILPDS